MAWIESHQSLQRHSKTGIAASMLKISRVQLIGHLQCLWWWGVDNASPDGRLSKNITPQMLAEAAEFSVKKADNFVKALITCGGDKAGFIDVIDGTYFLHDWYDYAGKFGEKKVKSLEEKRRGGQKRMENMSPEQRSELAKKAASHRWNASEMPAGDASYSRQNMPATVPKQHNLTKEVITTTSLPPPSDDDEKKVFVFWVNEGFGKLTIFESERLRNACECYTGEWVYDALVEAINHKAKNWAYISKVLKNWKELGRNVSPDEVRKITGLKSKANKFQKGKYSDVVKDCMDEIEKKPLKKMEDILADYEAEKTSKSLENTL
jgi:DnaD/phage-associated family protein